MGLEEPGGPIPMAFVELRGVVRLVLVNATVVGQAELPVPGPLRQADGAFTDVAPIRLVSSPTGLS